MEYLEVLKLLTSGGAPCRLRRTTINKARGTWTPEMEERFQHDLEVTGYGKTRYPYHGVGSEHRCAYADCCSGGTLSAGGRGGGPWYCSKHFRP